MPISRRLQVCYQELLVKESGDSLRQGLPCFVMNVNKHPDNTAVQNKHKSRTNKATALP